MPIGLARRGLASSTTNMESVVKNRKSPRALIEFAALEARRLMCMAGDPIGISTLPLGDSDPSPIHEMSAPKAIDTLIVPAFSSRPSASRKVYLDFNGYGSIDNWGGWWEFGGVSVPTTPAYDTDGDSSTWSNQELANIEKIWKGAAEKFSPFDVDVTTVRPSKINGVRVVIGGDG